VKGALHPSNTKRVHMDEKITELGEIKEEKNRKVKRKKNRKVTEIEAVLLLCLTSILQPV